MIELILVKTVFSESLFYELRKLYISIEIITNYIFKLYNKSEIKKMDLLVHKLNENTNAFANLCLKWFKN